MKKSILIVIVLMCFLSSKAQDEYQAKAFFIYNFTRLVEWPSSETGEFVIGIVGNSPIYDKLNTIVAGKKAGNLPIVIKHFKNPEEIAECNILYIAYGASSKMTLIQGMVKNNHTLIVGEKDGLTGEGAAINFILNNNRLSFRINVDNAQKQGLKVSKSLVDMSS